MPQDLQLWRERNPLRRFRTKSPALSLRECAIRLNVSPTSVSQWESGAVWPRTPQMAKIAKFMNTETTQLEAEWSSWFRELHPEGKTRRHDSFASVAA